MKLVENNKIKSIFINFKIDNFKLCEIYGGKKTVNIGCDNPNETLKKSDHIYRCDGTDVNLRFFCYNGATLVDKSAGVILNDESSFIIQITEF